MTPQEKIAVKERRWSIVVFSGLLALTSFIIADTVSGLTGDMGFTRPKAVYAMNDGFGSYQTHTRHTVHTTPHFYVHTRHTVARNYPFPSHTVHTTPRLYVHTRHTVAKQFPFPVHTVHTAPGGYPIHTRHTVHTSPRLTQNSDGVTTQHVSLWDTLVAAIQKLFA